MKARNIDTKAFFWALEGMKSSLEQIVSLEPWKDL